MKTLFYLSWVLLALCLACSSPANQQKGIEANADSTEVPSDWQRRFEGRIQEFVAEDSAYEGPAYEVIFLGSSSFGLWKTLSQDLAPYRVLNRGFGGSTFPEATLYAQKIVAAHAPQLVFVYEGDNDLVHQENFSSEAVINNAKVLGDELLKWLPDSAKVYFFSIKPSPKRLHLWERASAINAALRDYTASHPRLGFVDVSSPLFLSSGHLDTTRYQEDGIHMNESGYSLWKDVTLAVLKKELGPR